MADPIWLDNNVVSNALKGDAAVNQQLAAFRNSGRQLLVPPAVANELLNGNIHTMLLPKNAAKPTHLQTPSPQSRAALKRGMEKLGIEIDWSSSQVSMNKRIDYGQIGVDNVSISDRLVLSQIKAGAEARGIAKPQMVTGEGPKKGMMAQTSKWGIESVPQATPKPGSVPAAPRIDLADYPPDREGPLSRFFKDRPVLKKAGLIGVKMGADWLSKEMLDWVEGHFISVLGGAQKEFESKYPDPVVLKAKANLDRYRQAYDAALSKLNAPTRAKVAESVILAFTRDRDIEAAKKFMDDQISKVKSAADGTISGYSKVALEYTDAMIALYKQVSATQMSLVGIAADIQKRGSIIKSAGDSLDEEFWRYIPYAAAFPVLYYEWMNVHAAATVFENVGMLVLAFASEIEDRYNSYVLVQKELDEELVKVSNELAKYEP